MGAAYAWVLVWALVLGAAPGVEGACDDAAVIVVVSVLVTLAVVAVVLGIIGFMLWRRRRGVSRPMKLKNQGPASEQGSPTGKFAYANPAFDKDPTDPEKAEGVAGVPSYVVCRDVPPDQPKFDSGENVSETQEHKSGLTKELATKTWSSFPNSSEPTRYRRESTGSLDRNSGAGDGDIISVWLHSQDFVGLGFNIAGSMRDGIYVSQVHNRGPANESGKFKVGDRILSATISFENMVYEDALTILSYASPYPVKICLQKQEQMPKSRRLSDSRINLNHPLYRSQSVNALSNISKETPFHPKRSNSEMRPDKRDSPKGKRPLKSTFESNIAEEGGASPTTNKASSVSQAAVTVHRIDSPTSEKSKNTHLENGMSGTDLPNATVDLNQVNVAQTDTDKDNRDRDGFDELDASNSDFASVFDTLTEQDKLDMIRLSYAEDMTQVQSMDANLAPAFIKSDHRCVPVKPERKNKRSSTASTASMSDTELPSSTPSSPKSPKSPVTQSYIDDTTDDIVTPLTPPTEAPPPVPEDDSEADEALIQPDVKTRVVSVHTDKIQFEPTSSGKLDTSDISADRTVVADSEGDSFFSDMDTTLVKSSRPESPVGVPINEESIAATQISKGEFEIPNFKSTPKDIDKHKKCDSISSSSSSSSNEESATKLVESKTNDRNQELGQDVDPVSGTDLEKDFPHLDMNLNFETDSVLYKETFPNRNTKQAGSGMAYDISVMELASMENKMLEQCAEKEHHTGKHGIAFEIRDNLITGVPQTVTTHSVHRTASYDIRKTSSNSSDNETLSNRPTSLKGEVRKDNTTDSTALEWSGQRLVRSGSFSEIPQDDSVKDWTNNQNLDEDDVIIEQHIQEDSVSKGMKKLTKATLFQARDNNVDLSDSDTHCRSISSSSSSVGSSPERETYDFKNGNDDGIGMSPDTSPAKIPPDSKSDLIKSIAKYGSHDEVFTVTLTAGSDTEA